MATFDIDTTPCASPSLLHALSNLCENHLDYTRIDYESNEADGLLGLRKNFWDIFSELDDDAPFAPTATERADRDAQKYLTRLHQELSTSAAIYSMAAIVEIDQYVMEFVRYVRRYTTFVQDAKRDRREHHARAKGKRDDRKRAKTQTRAKVRAFINQTIQETIRHIQSDHQSNLAN